MRPCKHIFSIWLFSLVTFHMYIFKDQYTLHNHHIKKCYGIPACRCSISQLSYVRVLVLMNISILSIIAMGYVFKIIVSVKSINTFIALVIECQDSILKFLVHLGYSSWSADLRELLLKRMKFYIIVFPQLLFLLKLHNKVWYKYPSKYIPQDHI